MKYLLALFFCISLSAAQPMWIWKQGKIKTEKAEFQKTLKLKKKPNSANMQITCDNSFTLIINGKKVAESKVWQNSKSVDLTKHLNKGDNHFLIKADNEGNLGGLIFHLTINKSVYVSDKSWQARSPEGKWQTANEVAKYGQKPWGNVFANMSSKGNSPSSIIPVKVPEGFKVEKLYDVDKITQGSWVGLCSDDKGRIIACDQYGGIFRITLTDAEPEVEKLNVKVSHAHGLLHAFGSLYVINNEKDPKGLYRLTDTNGDDQYDKEEFLIQFKTRGEHGIHSAVLGPEKIYLSRWW